MTLNSRSIADGSRRSWLAAGDALPMLAWSGALRAQAKSVAISWLDTSAPERGRVLLKAFNDGMVTSLTSISGSVTEKMFELPTVFQRAVNPKAASSLGIVIPPSIMVRATEVIE